MRLDNIRNFSIIAHIDHGKSTLADRLLEVTGTIEKRKMRDQVLDSMELERERGITIKMQPVKMNYKLDTNTRIVTTNDANDTNIYNLSPTTYTLNLIDTPGHIDFSYEVSRALRAVEGSILLVDATQGVQAQTLTTLEMARELGLVIIPAVSKIDSPLARTDEVKMELALLLGCELEDVIEVSGRTGEGVEKLLEEVIKKIPPPKTQHDESGIFRGLVFDFKYDNHRGVIVFVRVLDGSAHKNDTLVFASSKEQFLALEVGSFSPAEVPSAELSAGSIGYIVTGIKRPGVASVGDTIIMPKKPLPPMEGYMQPLPVVWASVYPESQDDFNDLKMALGRLRLSDSAFSYEEEASGILGRGFRVGFLGMLHLEIITERLRREFNLDLVVTLPSITYEVTFKNGKTEMVYSPHLFPDDGAYSAVREPWIVAKIITPADYIGILMPFLYDHEAEVRETINFGDNRSQIVFVMPLRELMRNFFDDLKSITSGYASIAYDIDEMRPADVTRLDILLADEVVPAFTKVISKRRAEEEAEQSTEKLQTLLPRQQFEMKVQGRALGRIISSRAIKAFRKDVLMHGSKVVGGGDVSRKKKLLEKQKKGKKKMRETGKVNIPAEVFVRMIRSNE